ncbi:MAG: N-acetyl-alpha-D-glucosaminyl L-malate synthase BshA [Bacteroidia bacterium]|nr:N-acetyl-alpha-D-glucosaminyl L-malate synthase BshA [Bacteroidia bacterium]
MNIGIVCYPTFGGSGVVATELGKALAAKGHCVHFISYALPVRLSAFEENITYHEVTVSDYPLFEYPPYELALANQIVDVARYEKLDLLHVHYAIPHASAAYLAKQMLAAEGIKLPFITTLHGTDITIVGKDPSFEAAISFAINESDAVTAVSESLKQDTYYFFRKVKKEIAVIPNFVCLEHYNLPEAGKHRKFYATGAQKIIVHISNFRKVKRVDDVVRIFDLVRKKIPSRLLLVGDGPEKTNIEKQCRDLGACSEIQFLGKITEPNTILAIADLFLLPSETESFGLAALEAMAAGVPVVSSNKGGLPEINVHGYSGMMRNVGDTAGMADDALYILSDEKRLVKFKNNARKQAQKFAIDKVLPQYEKLYRKVLAKKHRK